MFKKIFSVVMSLALIISLSAIQPVSVSAATIKVTFYSNANYNGNDVTVEMFKNDTISLSRAGLEDYGIKNDDISSIKVPAGYVVRIYKDDNFKGSYWSFESDVSNLKDYGCDNVMSSLKISVADTISGVTFYTDANYIENDVKIGLLNDSLYLSREGLKQYGISNDDVSSIKIPNGYTVRIYEDDNFKGNYWTFTSDVSNLKDYGCNDTMSSLIITRE